MATARLNGIRLHYEVVGEGEPLVLVHGSWDRHEVWTAAAARLADRYRVISYDRRGHSRSERPPGPRTRRQDEGDLAAVIEEIAGGPAYVAANSFGGVITLGLVAERPELFRAAAVHEPPAMSLADEGELAEHAGAAMAVMNELVAELETGAAEAGTRRFIEEIALGPGTWELIPAEDRAALVANAPAFVAEQRDPQALELDSDAVRDAGVPVLVMQGDQSPPLLRMLADRLAERLPGARTATIPGAGHIPHETHPELCVKALDAFFARHAEVAA